MSAGLETKHGRGKCKADPSALWAEADCRGRRNKTALFRTAGADAVAAFAVSEAQGFLSLFCGLSLSFARKKEKPPSGLKLATAARWPLQSPLPGREGAGDVASPITRLRRAVPQRGGRGSPVETSQPQAEKRRPSCGLPVATFAASPQKQRPRREPRTAGEIQVRFKTCRKVCGDLLCTAAASVPAAHCKLQTANCKLLRIVHFRRPLKNGHGLPRDRNSAYCIPH